MLLHGIFSFLLLLLAIGGIVALIRLTIRPPSRPTEASRRSPGLDVLEQRYAAGEIDRDEYLQKKSDLGG